MAAGLYDITNEILGKGHFAIVKLAKHCLTGEHVAIKIIDKSKLDKEGLEQLSCEIRLWSILSEHEHPNVVKLYQCIDTRTKLYLVMEYCGGQVCDLYDYIQKKNDGNGLDEEDAKHIFRQVCNAILYCHSLKIVHRDLKPENILIIQNKNTKNNLITHSIYPMVKLIDFGFSNQWVDNELLRTSCGSLAYSAPEILLGNQYDGPKVDIWGLGCILYILLYGCNPFMQFNDNETLTKILDCSFTTPEKPSVSESSIDLIKSLLKKNPETRLSIEEIMIHPWLENKSQFTSNNNKKETKMPVHEHIIDQMINQGIALPKEMIEKILNNEYSINEELNDENGDKINDHHYIKATYQLLKDKSVREFKGITDQKPNSIYNKRGNILKKPNYSNSKKHNLIHEKKTIEPNLNSLSNNNTKLTSLEVPENSNSFVLPLARKCSIVSEEGSVCAENNISEVAIPEKSNELENTHPSVDIFVTDSSLDTTNKYYNSNLIQESVSDFSINQNAPDSPSNKKTVKKVNYKDSGLHPVSSSPDFLNSQTINANDQVNDKTKNSESKLCDLSQLGSELKHKEKFSISDFSDENIFNRYSNYPNVQNKINNVRVMKAPAAPSLDSSCQSSNKSPSMRVIIQSKSLNNIALVEQTETKMANSMSTVSIKAPKTEKTDCCTIF